MYHKDVIVVVNRHDDCGVPPSMPERVSAQNFVLCWGTRASQKGLLDEAGDPPSFNAGIIDPTCFSRDVPVNLTLQLTRRES